MDNKVFAGARRRPEVGHWPPRRAKQIAGAPSLANEASQSERDKLSALPFPLELALNKAAAAAAAKRPLFAKAAAKTADRSVSRRAHVGALPEEHSLALVHRLN